MFLKSGERSHRRQWSILSFCFLLLLLTGCGSWWPWGGENTHYRIAGIPQEQAELRSYMESILEDRLEREIEQTANPEENIRREADREQTIRADLEKALRARGYYEGEVVYEDSGARVTGIYRVKSGSRYTIERIVIMPDEFSGIANLDFLKPGAPLDAEKILEAQRSLYNKLDRDGCYFTLEVTNRVVLNEQTDSGAVTFVVNAGKRAEFGEVKFTGHENIRESYLRKLVPWRPGQCFRRAAIENFRNRLLGTGLFSRANAVLPDDPGPDGRVEITIELAERASRSVEAGLSYYTDEGIGARLGWEHRNILGGAEKLEALLNWSQVRQVLRLDFHSPFFLSKKQSFHAHIALRRQESDAFEERGLDTEVSIRRSLFPNTSGSAGVGALLTEIDERGETRTYGLLYTPAKITFDTRNDLLNPKRGWLLTGAVTPFFDAFGESDPFVKVVSGARTYVDLGTDHELVLALRGEAGSIMGTTTFDIPATERFFVGGGGSVRGYGYQEVGPIIDGDPTGGRSMVIGSAEARFKVAGDFGGVIFVDGGSVSLEAQPDLSDFSVGAGAGVRYYTSFGPLRLDVAVPLNRKDELDKTYQVYVSIGQAF